MREKKRKKSLKEKNSKRTWEGKGNGQKEDRCSSIIPSIYPTIAGDGEKEDFCVRRIAREMNEKEEKKQRRKEEEKFLLFSV